MKKKILAAMLAVVMVFGLTGCRSSHEGEGNWCEYDQIGSFKNIGDNLFYDTNTKIVYVIMTDVEVTYKGYGFMSPYISENGNFCKYDGNEVVEIQ